MSEGGTRAAVLVGGVIGTLGRWFVGTALSDAGAGWRWSTLTVNLTGALVMGLLVAWLATRSTPSPLLRPFVAVGVLGGWTTYSGFALDTHAALDGNDMIGAVGYVLATIVLGVGASLVGLIAGERWFGPPSEGAERVVDEERP